ncbi:MAG: phaC PHA synthase [Psychrilyobacter sp.]|uniref:LA_2272 family surface repeat-containing protein n=1 Tax=Psychrilyobacter sp. TaxID=2586924 RepID=UPI003C71781B
MKRIKILLGMLCLISTMTFAETPFQLGVPGTNLPAEQRVNGVRLNLLYGENRNMTGLDINILALGETNNFTGVQLSPFWLGANKVNNSFTGVGIGAANIHMGQSTGVVWGMVNYTNDFNGLQLGFVNFNQKKSVINLGGFNFNQGESTVDIGVVNFAERTTFQLGAINFTNNLQGIQIGFINFAKNGFFPVFPIFNIDGRL